LARPFQQDGENLKGLFLKLDFSAVPHFARHKIDGERAKAAGLPILGGHLHGQ
jgi:hypothetical protein